MSKSPERRDQCCLCGKTKEQVKKLIVGLHGAVCSDCIDLCNDILNNEPERHPRPMTEEPPAAAAPAPVSRVPTPKESVEFLDR
ncbi:MAG: hypothetical protein LDL56_10055, partial [Armatimonadetes bacterium]|nr:hypothetical protein [Armatimonadota bacterium]